MSDDDETVHLRKLLNILRHRKRLYELQIARTSPNTDPAVVIGLDGTEQEIRLVEAKLRRPKIGAEVLEAVGTDGLFLDLSVQIAALTDAQQTNNERTEATATQVEVLVQRVDVLDARTADGAAWREAETEKRRHGQRRTRRRDALIAGAIVVLALERYDTMDVSQVIFATLALIGIVVLVWAIDRWKP